MRIFVCLLFNALNYVAYITGVVTIQLNARHVVTKCRRPIVPKLKMLVLVSSFFFPSFTQIYDIYDI